MGKELPRELCEQARTGDAEGAKRALVADPHLAQRCDEGGRLLLHWAASGGCDPLFRYLLTLHPDQLDEPDEAGWTALMIAASAGHQALAQLALQQGASADHANTTGQRPLHYAASKGHVPIVKMLLENGASPNGRDQYGGTPIHRAASKGNVKVLQLLLEHPNCNVDASAST